MYISQAINSLSLRRHANCVDTVLLFREGDAFGAGWLGKKGRHRSRGSASKILKSSAHHRVPKLGRAKTNPPIDPLRKCVAVFFTTCLYRFVVLFRNVQPTLSKCSSWRQCVLVLFTLYRTCVHLGEVKPCPASAERAF